MKAKVQFLPLLLISSALSLSTVGCATARLEPASADQKVANKPNAAITEVSKGVQIQVEAGVWMADDRVKDEVTAMKVTLINRSAKATTISSGDFVLVSDGGKTFAPVPANKVSIRGATRSIGLPADSIVTRSSDSAVNAPNREMSEKDQIRERLQQQELRSGEVPPGERTVGYIFFERVPASVKTITFKGSILDDKGKRTDEASLEFRPRQYK